MKLFSSVLFVTSTEGGDAIDERECLYAHGHVDKGDFLAAVFEANMRVNIPPGKVAHAWVGYENEDGTELTGLWDLEKTQETPEPVTMAFV